MLEVSSVQAACVLILRADGLVLAVTRKGTTDDFGLPGGKCDPDDEDAVATAIRETLEETGVRLKREHLRRVFVSEGRPHKTGLCATYLVSEYDDEDLGAKEEDTVVTWVPRSELVDDRSTFKHYNRRLFAIVAESLSEFSFHVKRD